MEAPISAVNGIILGLIVTAIVISFFVTNIGTSTNSVDLTAAISSGCANFRTSLSCDETKISKITVSMKNKEIGLSDLCSQMGLTKIWGCMVECGCISKSDVPKGVPLTKLEEQEQIKNQNKVRLIAEDVTLPQEVVA